MQAHQVAPYLLHRLTVAAISDATDVDLFLPDAVRDITACSAGVPRLINALAHKCLMLAYGENTHRITTAHVRLAADDTPGVRARRAAQRQGARAWLPGWLTRRGESR